MRTKNGSKTRKSQKKSMRVNNVSNVGQPSFIAVQTTGKRAVRRGPTCMARAWVGLRMQVSCGTSRVTRSKTRRPSMF